MIIMVIMAKTADALRRVEQMIMNMLIWMIIVLIMLMIIVNDDDGDDGNGDVVE